MEFLLNRYRNLSVLLVAILAQLALLAYQIKSKQDVRLLHVWAVSAVTPLARVIEAGRYGGSHFFHDYFVLLGVREENSKMRAEMDRLQMENQYLHAELSTADRAQELAAHVIGHSTDSGANVIIVDRGSADGVQKGLAVVTPEGIVGKVINVYPPASFVLLITDPSFAAFVVSEKHHIHGTLKGQADGTVIIDHVQNEETVEPGELFLASGDDLIFPRGTPAGRVTVVRDGPNHKEIYLNPSGLQKAYDDVLILIDGVHGAIPDAPSPDQTVHLLPPPKPDESTGTDVPAQSGAHVTDLDRAVEQKARSERQNDAPADPAHSARPSPRP
jgi:rod shape-determining protein MreC